MKKFVIAASIILSGCSTTQTIPKSQLDALENSFRAKLVDIEQRERAKLVEMEQRETKLREEFKQQLTEINKNFDRKEMFMKMEHMKEITTTKATRNSECKFFCF